MICTKGGEFREFFDLDPPAFIISEMEMEDIDLVMGQEIDESEDIVLGGEVSGNVQEIIKVPGRKTPVNAEA